MFEERDVESSNAEAVRMITTLRRTFLCLQSVFSSRSHSHAICSVTASKSFRCEPGSGFSPIVVDEKELRTPCLPFPNSHLLPYVQSGTERAPRFSEVPGRCSVCSKQPGLGDLTTGERIA